MSDELNIIRLFRDSRETFVTYSPPVLKLPNLDRNIKLILKCIGDFYDRFTDKDKITPEDFKEFFSYCNPVYKETPIVFDLIDQSAQVTATKDIIRLSLEKLTEASFATEILTTLTPVIEGSKFGVMLEAQDLIEQYKTYIGHVDDAGKLKPYFKSISQLKAEDQRDQDISWPLKELNNYIGSPRRKTSGAFFARPDTGKTSFGINTACKWAASLHFRNKDGVILYCQNEESIDKIWMRILCSMCDVVKDYAYNNEVFVENRFLQMGGNRLILLEDIYHISTLEEAIKKFSPRAVIVDQTPKLQVPGGWKMNKIDKLQAIYEKSRELAKTYDTSILNLSQATSTAHNREYLVLNDMHNSKTDVPGELDYVIGMGAKDDPAFERVRFFNICKNKEKDGLKKRFQATFEFEKARYKDA